MATSGSEDRVLKLVIWWIFAKMMDEDCYWDTAQNKRIYEQYSCYQWVLI